MALTGLMIGSLSAKSYYVIFTIVLLVNASLFMLMFIFGKRVDLKIVLIPAFVAAYSTVDVLLRHFKGMRVSDLF